MIRRNSMLWAVLALTAVCLFFLSNHGMAKSSSQQKDTVKEKTPQNTLKKQETKPTDPFTIQKLSLKDNKIQVTVQAAAGVDVSSGKYTIIKLKIEPQLGKGKQEWSISEVYGKGTPAIRAGEVVFNTGINITEQQLITATLYGGGWQTVKRERLGMALAKTTTRAFQPGSQSKEAPLGGKTTTAFNKDISKFVPSHQGVPLRSGESHGIEVSSPPRGAYYHFGDTISVWWSSSDDEPPGDTCRVTLRRDSVSEGTFDHVLYDAGMPTMDSRGGYHLPVTLPAKSEISKAHDYYIHVAKYTADEPHWGDSRAFSIGDPLDPGVDWRDREPVVSILRPRGGETWYITGASSSARNTVRPTYEVRWMVWPRERDVVPTWRFWGALDGGSDYEFNLASSVYFNNATREYWARVEVPVGVPSGSYVVAVRSFLIDIETGETTNFDGHSSAIKIDNALSVKRGIKILRPVEGTRIHAGQSFELRWVPADVSRNEFSSGDSRKLYSVNLLNAATLETAAARLADVWLGNRHCDLEIPLTVEPGDYVISMDPIATYDDENDRYYFNPDNQMWARSDRIEVLPASPSP